MIARILFSILTLVIALAFQTAQAVELTRSARSEIFDNPFIATGFNPTTNVLTGYVSALRTAPGRTDECKFVFSGRFERAASFSVFVKDAFQTQKDDVVDPSKINHGEMTSASKQYKLIFDKKSLPGDCDWILPFSDEQKVAQNGNTYSILIDTSVVGDWLAVYIVRAKRVYFHKEPNESSAGKAFLVAGDLVYVYDEKPDWYFAKFHGQKKETVGWIKKSDTIRFPESLSIKK